MNITADQAIAPPSFLSALGARPFDYIFLQSLSDRNLCTVVELAVSFTTIEEDAGSSNSSQSMIFEMRLHPELTEFLIESSSSSPSTPTDLSLIDNVVTKKKSNTHQLVLLRSVDYSLDASSNNKKMCGLSTEAIFLASRVTKILDCASETMKDINLVVSGTLYEVYVAQSGQPDDDNQMSNQIFLQYVEDSLQGKVVTTRSIVALEMDITDIDPPSHRLFTLVVESVELCTHRDKLSPKEENHHNENASFVSTPNSVSPNDLAHKNTSHSLFYKIGPPGSCVLNLQFANEKEENNDDNHPLCFDQPWKMSNIRPVSSPGYEYLVDQIVALARINHCNGAPTGVLLTGCEGVGKTNLAQTLSQKLETSQGVDMFPHQTIVHKVCAKNVLLSPVMSSNPVLDVSKILLPRNRQRLVLIIDSLEVLLTNGDGFESNDNECASALHEILKVVDNVVKLGASLTKHNVPPPFVLGLYRTDAAKSPFRFPPQLVRVGRFEKILEMSPPTQAQREQIIEHLLQHIMRTRSTVATKTMTTSESLLRSQQEEPFLAWDCIDAPARRKTGEICKLWSIALGPRTAGCVASDLRQICVEAWRHAFSRHHLALSTIKKNNISEDLQRLHGPGTSTKSTMENIEIRWEDLRESARRFVPSQLAQMDVCLVRFTGDEVHENEIASAINDKKGHHQYRFDAGWGTFGGYTDMKKKLKRSILGPWRRARCSSISKLAIDTPPPSGVLFHGPPGCGKTMAAHCLASSLGIHMIKVKATDILDQWLGGSEATIRSIFSRARSAAPCLLFFDEIDALAANREDTESGGGNSDVHSRILSTLLNEMDGISNSVQQEVLVVAATNRLTALDAALLRPGRLQEHVFIPLPTKSDCFDILTLRLKDWSVDGDLDLNQIAEDLFESGASGADIDGLCREASLHAIRERLDLSSNLATNDDESKTDCLVSVSLADFECAMDHI